MTINVCTREKYAIPGEENFILIKNNEKIALNPIFIDRLEQFYSTMQAEYPREEVVLAARTVDITVILTASKVQNWIAKYRPLPA